MPTLLLLNGIRFFFYSNENEEPIHIHVQKGNAKRKIWLEPAIKVAYLIGISIPDERDILDAVQKVSVNFKKKWNEYFGK